MARPKKSEVEIDDEVEEVKNELMGKTMKQKVDLGKALSTGSTLLNLACSGKLSAAFLPSTFNYLVGDSASGKSFLTLTCLAEAAKNKDFNNYRFIFDDVEGGAMMDVEKFFGKKVAERLEPPAVDKKTGLPISSGTIEEFFYHIDDALDEGRPFIYILDSMDGLSSDSEVDKFQEQKIAHQRGKQISGSYGDGKAKKNSAGIRQVLSGLKKTGSILIIISQTRDNIGFGAQFNPKTRSGGHALRFYATLELWSSIKGKINKTVRGEQTPVGINCQVKVKKNRLTGRERDIVIPIYYSTGFDDTGSCVQFLIENKHWKKVGKSGEEVNEENGKKKSGVIDAKEFDYSGNEEGLIKHIEETGQELELKLLVSTVWDEIEAESEVIRKKRYE